MSVVVAVKQGDTVYMGADTQTTCGGDIEHNVKNEVNYKITKMPNDILVGHTGIVAEAMRLTLHDEWFEKLPKKGLTKEFIIKEIVPKFRRELESINAIKEGGKRNGTVLIAQKDKLFLMKSNFEVFKINTEYAIGTGMVSAFAWLREKKELPLRERMLGGLRLAADSCDSVSGPYIFIDTKNLQYEMVK